MLSFLSAACVARGEGCFRLQLLLVSREGNDVFVGTGVCPMRERVLCFALLLVSRDSVREGCFRFEVLFVSRDIVRGGCFRFEVLFVIA